MYQAADARYDGMTYNRCGSSGLRLPAVSLGFWHNLAAPASMRQCGSCVLPPLTMVSRTLTLPTIMDRSREVLRKSGTDCKGNFMPYRDELIISTKAGYEMWNGPYGTGQPQIPARKPRSEPYTPGTSVCRHFLPSPDGPGDAA